MINVKNIKKIGISLALIFSVISPNYVFADEKLLSDSENIQVLLYEEALNLAIKESNDIKNVKLEKDSNTVPLSK